MVVSIEMMARAAPRERTDLNSYTPCPPEATQREGGQTCRKKTHQALRSVTLRSPEATRREGERTLRLNINSTQSQNITNSSQTRAMVFCVMLAAAMSLTLISATS